MPTVRVPSTARPPLAAVTCQPVGPEIARHSSQSTPPAVTIFRPAHVCRKGTTIRDIEYGRDAKLSNILAIANALGLVLELAEQTA